MANPFSRFQTNNIKINLRNSKNFMTYYDILRIDPDSNQKEIEKAYKKQALVLHPDRNQNENKEEATDQFQKLSEAYEILRDPIKRKKYDQRVLNSIALDLDLGGLNNGNFNSRAKNSEFSSRFDSNQSSSSSPSPSTSSSSNFQFRNQATYNQSSKPRQSSSSSGSSRPRTASFNYPDFRPSVHNNRPPPEARSTAPPLSSSFATAKAAQNRRTTIAVPVSNLSNAQRDGPTSFVKPSKGSVKSFGTQCPTFYFKPRPQRADQYSARREPSISVASPTENIDPSPGSRHEDRAGHHYGEAKDPLRRAYQQSSTRNHSDHNLASLPQKRPESVSSKMNFGNSRSKNELLDEYMVFNSVWGKDLEELEHLSLSGLKKRPGKATVQSQSSSPKKSLSPNVHRSYSLEDRGNEHPRRSPVSNRTTVSGQVGGNRTREPVRPSSADVKLQSSRPRLGVFVPPTGQTSNKLSNNNPIAMRSNSNGFEGNETGYSSPNHYGSSSSWNSQSSSRSNPRRTEEPMSRSGRTRSSSTSQADPRSPPQSSSTSSFKSYQKEYVIRICHEQDGSSKVQQELRSRLVGLDGSVVDRYRRLRRGVGY